ncbi:hypothetical protein ACIQRW_37990 [Streptomyces sp. NPDC091287]|uniref:hypothetical protein n=1 Tax=Streptomyces sp. NPDC091287 TaxID=3365988 RepID=UPI0037F52C1C
MTTPAPAPAQLSGEPFSEALSEAAQAAAMSVRLILTIADAVRRASQKHHHGQEQELTQDFGQVAESWWSADELGKHLPASLLDHLTASEDWPVMSRQLISLSRAGVDLTTFLPNLGSMAAGVERAVAKNIARTKAEGTDRWAELLRTTIPEAWSATRSSLPRPGPTSPPPWAASTTRASTSPASSPTPTPPASASTRPSPPSPSPPPRLQPPRPPRPPPRLRPPHLRPLRPPCRPLPHPPRRSPPRRSPPLRFRPPRPPP